MAKKRPAAGGVRAAALIAAALLAFAANSVLARMALGGPAIDPASYTVVRLASGALTLWLIVSFVTGRNGSGSRGTWTSAAMLFLYAIAFSFAYLSLDTGVGALILFGMVQVTMIVAGLRAGERPHPLQWAGLVIALAGLVYLVSPGLAAPSLSGAVLMALAGVAWGIYSLRGRGAADPVAVTADNFLRSVPFVLPVGLVMLPQAHLSVAGLSLALASGALASGVGYVIWYAALPALSATRAATVQLSVPILAAFGGVFLLAEQVSLRHLIAAVLILGGVGLTVLMRERRHGDAQRRVLRQ